jgi:hypothetical protein
MRPLLPFSANRPLSATERSAKQIVGRAVARGTQSRDYNKTGFIDERVEQLADLWLQIGNSAASG